MEPSSSTQPRTAMVSGHIDISPTEFVIHYIPAIDVALSSGDHFILGDAQGTDSLALEYLLEHGGPDIKHRIKIHASRPYNVAKFQAMGLVSSTDPPADTVASSPSNSRGKGRRQGDSRARHLLRDARMTTASDYDILWARNEEEARKLYGGKYKTRVSATELNRLRRLEVLKEAKAVTSSSAEISHTK